MHVEILTWDEIQALPEFMNDALDTGSTYWNQEKETDFSSRYSDRIVELLHDEPDSDGDYECEYFFYPLCIIKQFIPNNIFGTHRILKKASHDI